jgi:hypothetical protein
MRNHVHQIHITLKLKLKKKSYIIIVQLSFKKYDVLINKLPCQKVN